MQDRSSSTPLDARPYGAAELKEYEPRALLLSFALSVLVLSSMVSVLRWTFSLPADAPDGRQDSLKLVYWPPSVFDEPRSGGRKVPKAVSSFAIPIPAPIEEVDTTSAFPTNEQLGWIRGEFIDSGEGKGGVVVTPPEEVAPNVFVPREVEPVAVSVVKPLYPTVAIRAGIEGNVYVRVWVDKQGQVRDAVIIKSDGAIFDEPALAAARRWVFTPALMQDRPVSVWVTIPLRFRLNQESGR